MLPVSLTQMANLPLVLTIPAVPVAKFATGVIGTGVKFATGVIGTGVKFATGVVDNGSKIFLLGSLKKNLKQKIS